MTDYQRCCTGALSGVFTSASWSAGRCVRSGSSRIPYPVGAATFGALGGHLRVFNWRLPHRDPNVPPPLIAVKEDLGDQQSALFEPKFIEPIPLLFF
jgi:hypothetical protein